MAFEKLESYLVPMRDGKRYLPVAARLIWFRNEHPDWAIETHPLHLDMDAGVAVYQATIKDAEGRVIAMASKMETRQSFADFVEKAETGAVGRALAMCGYGTQFAVHELDEGERVVDAPQPLTSKQGAANTFTRSRPQRG
jgi:hypothetical protein